ncbi:MAG: hypothetical protein GXY33_13770 [Phycisphaerae bacterium]|nr:hypothetical protein [Phycisphaerae bacterium]
MNPWTQILDRIWFYLEEGPASAGVTAAFAPANRCRYGVDERDAPVPQNADEAVLIVDQSGGQLDLNHSPAHLRASEDFQIAIWTDTLALGKVNALRLAVAAALEAGLPDLGLARVLEVRMRTGRLTLALDKVEQDADGRLMQWRNDLRRSRQRAVLLELTVTFLIGRDELSAAAT